MVTSFQLHRLALGAAGALAMLVVAFAPVATHAASDAIVTQTVKGSFDSTVTSLKKAITAHKLVIVKEVPYTQMLGMVGVKSEAMMGFEIFHPRYGKALYESDKDAFLEAPLRILLRDEGGEVMIQYRKPSAVFAGYSGLSSLGAELDEVFANIVSGVAK